MNKKCVVITFCMMAVLHQGLCACGERFWFEAAQDFRSSSRTAGAVALARSVIRDRAPVIVRLSPRTRAVLKRLVERARHVLLSGETPTWYRGPQHQAK